MGRSIGKENFFEYVFFDIEVIGQKKPRIM